MKTAEAGIIQRLAARTKKNPNMPKGLLWSRLKKGDPFGILRHRFEHTASGIRSWRTALLQNACPLPLESADIIIVPCRLYMSTW